MLYRKERLTPMESAFFVLITILSSELSIYKCQKLDVKLNKNRGTTLAIGNFAQGPARKPKNYR